MTEMLERVAQAIYENGRTRWPPAFWTYASEDDKELSRGYARAALNALLAPTEEMVTAGERGEDGKETYAAMIVAALVGLPPHMRTTEP